MTPADVERRVGEIQWPGPSPDLRARVLSTVAIPERHATWSDRVWFSRGWRLAAAMAVMIALAVEAFSSALVARRSVDKGQASADAQAVDDVGREVGLPSTLTAALARRVLVSDARHAAVEREALEVEGVAR
jgi:hypothetical protein